MAVPKKKKSYMKCKKRFNVLRLSKLNFSYFIYCKNCLFLKKNNTACSNCFFF